MKQAIMSYITALINVHNNALERITDRVANSNIKVFTSELNDLLDYVSDIPEDSKRPVTVVLNEGNCKCEIYKQVLEEVLSNLRSIDSPNPADSYIDESIEIIKKVMEETK